MPHGIRLKVWGDYALFTRPEFKGERVSYDVITPSAARGILEAVYWKPAIRWVIDRLHVLKPVRFDNVRRNELAGKTPAGTVKRAMQGSDVPLQTFIEKDRQQRASLLLRDVAYVIEAHFEFTGSEDRNDGKHLDSFNRRAAKGSCFHRPYLGCREFAAHFAPVEEPLVSELAGEPDKDLGWMLYDIDFARDRTPLFYRPKLCKGVIDVARYAPKGAA